MDIKEFAMRSAPLFRRQGALKAMILGSHAREDADPRSDFDVIVIDDDDLPYLRRLDKYFDELYSMARGAVDLFVYRPSELARRRDLPFLLHALKDAVVI